MRWPLAPLGQLITLQRGYDLPENARRDGEVPVVTSSGITGYHDVAAEKGPGVVTGRYGTIGEVHYVEGDYWPHNTTLFVKDFKGNDPRFVRYLLTSLNLSNQVSSGAVPGVNRNVLHTLLVPDVPCGCQVRVADILSTYDDLIENNRRRMVLLEEAARQLYREWFVHLRFPGHEHMTIRDGVPEGWERKTLGDICREIRENVEPAEITPDYPYIGLEHMPRRSITLSDWSRADAVSSSKNRFAAGEILFGKIRPYFHKVGIAFVDGIASSDAIVIRPVLERWRSLVLMTASSDRFVADTAQSMREGSKMPRADWSLMQRYPIAVPSEGILTAFNESIELVVSQLKTLTFQNRHLRTARDLLLPRLMSGEITA